MARTDANVFVLLACLEPWVPALHRLSPPTDYMAQEHTDAEGSLILWFDGRELFEAANPSVSLDGVCEALSLLALIARGDPGLWKRVVLEIWTENERLRKYVEGAMPKKFGVGLEVTEVRLAWVTHITRLSDHMASSEAAAPSPQYREVWDFVKRELSIHPDNETEASNVRVRIELDCACGPGSESTTDMLEVALEVVKTEASVKDRRARASPADTRPRFTVTHVDFTTAIGVKLDRHSFRFLHELNRLGIPLTHLPAPTMEPSTAELPEFTQSLRDLVGLDDDNASANRGVSAVTINTEDSSWPVIRAMLTAAQQSSNVRTIELDFGDEDVYYEQPDDEYEQDGEHDDDDDDDAEDDDATADEVYVHAEVEEDHDEDDDDGEKRGEEEEDELDRLDDHESSSSELWQWIALTIFSRHANHNMESLELNTGRLQASEVDAVRRVLNAPNPYAVVRGRSGVVPATLVPRQIVTSHFVLEDPISCADDDDNEVKEPGPLFMTRKPIAVHVLERSDAWYEVLLPGHGAAWVYEHQVVSTSEDDLFLTNRQATPHPEFKHILISHMSDDSMDPVADLIGLIGHGTRRITYLEHMGDRGFDDWCTRVLATCPNLEQLEIHGAYVDNLDVFGASARAGHCRLRALHVRAPTGDIQGFFNTLSDPDHPLTEHLRELDVDLIVETTDPHVVIKAVLQMLSHNRRLVTIRLSLKLDDRTEPLRPHFEAAFYNRSSDAFVIRTAPLDLRCKIAFLSAVDPKSHARDTALSQLDASVLSIVFSFAAEGRVRAVDVFYESPGRFYS